MVRCSQSTSPEMAAWAVPLTENVRKSAFLSEETFHQKVNVPGPVTVVLSREDWPSKIGPACPAAIPSCEGLVTPCQWRAPSVTQTKPVELRAKSSGTVGITVSVATELVAEPDVLVTTTK